MTENLSSPVWDFESENPHFKAARVGAQAGAERIGACLYELGPGAKTGPLHAHRANEELLIVLSGTPLVRRESEVAEVLAPGAVVSLPAGPAGAHAIEHQGADVARVVVISTMTFPDVVEHPELGTFLIVSGPPDADNSEMLLFNRKDGIDVLREEPPPAT